MERARQFEICGFKSFRETVVHESKAMASLLPLPLFGKKAGEFHCRPQLQGER